VSNEPQPVLTTALEAWQRKGGPLRVQVTGWSMAPLLHPGDLIELAACAPAHLRPGDIVVVRHGATMLTHRLVRASAGMLLLHGDNLHAPDQPVAEKRIVGLVIARERGAQRLGVRSWAWMTLGYAYAAARSRPLRLLIRVALTITLAGISRQPSIWKETAHA
jgi:hypothetical protein